MADAIAMPSGLEQDGGRASTGGGEANSQLLRLVARACVAPLLAPRRAPARSPGLPDAQARPHMVPLRTTIGSRRHTCLISHVHAAESAMRSSLGGRVETAVGYCSVHLAMVCELRLIGSVM